MTLPRTSIGKNRQRKRLGNKTAPKTALAAFRTTVFQRVDLQKRKVELQTPLNKAPEQWETEVRVSPRFGARTPADVNQKQVEDRFQILETPALVFYSRPNQKPQINLSRDTRRRSPRTILLAALASVGSGASRISRA